MSDQTTTPPADYDSPWKEALARYLPEAFALFFPDVATQIDWMLALPPEQEALLLREVERIEEELRMPYITSAERIGLERGEQLGLQEGLREGRLEGQRTALRRLVQAQFGAVPEALGRQIDDAGDQLIGQLIDRIGAAASLIDLGAASKEAE